MGKHLTVPIEVINDNMYKIYKNTNFNFLICSCNSLYDEIIESMKKHYKTYEVKKETSKLIERLKSKSKFEELTKKELIWLTNWIDIICVILIEMDTINFKDKDVIKFFKSAQNFIDKTKKYIPDYEPQTLE